MANAATTAEGIQRREAILAFVREFMAENQYAPSQKEIGDAIGGVSEVSVARHLKIMAKQGVIWVGPNPRMIKILAEKEE